MTVVMYNAKNAINAVYSRIRIFLSSTCAAHIVQFAVIYGLRQDSVNTLYQSCSNVVGHFKRSYVG